MRMKGRGENAGYRPSYAARRRIGRGSRTCHNPPFKNLSRVNGAEGCLDGRVSGLGWVGTDARMGAAAGQEGQEPMLGRARPQARMGKTQCSARPKRSRA